MEDSSSSSRNKNPKLSVRNQTCFKKSSFSSKTKNMNLCLRERTILKKAYELSTLCENEICVIHYDRDGNLVQTWPHDRSIVKDIAERFSKLSKREKLKKSTNLSQFLNKKIMDEKKRSLCDNKNDNKNFTQKVLEIEGLLENHIQILQYRLRDSKDHQTTTEPDQSCLAVISEQNHNFPLSPSFFSKDLSSSSLTNDPLMNLISPSVIEDPDHQQQLESLTNLLMSGNVSTSTEQDLSRAVYNSGGSGFATDSFNHQSKFSVFLFNHENATFTQLPDSVSSSFNQTLTPYNNNLNDNTTLLGPQEFDFGYNNNLSTQGSNFEYKNNLNTALHGAQGYNFGYTNNLSTQGFSFGYDNNLSTQGFNFEYNNNLNAALHGEQGFNFGCNNNLNTALHGEQGFNFGCNNNLNTALQVGTSI